MTGLTLDDFYNTTVYVTAPLPGSSTPVFITKHEPKQTVAWRWDENKIEARDRLFMEMLEKAKTDPTINVYQEHKRIMSINCKTLGPG